MYFSSAMVLCQFGVLPLHRLSVTTWRGAPFSKKLLFYMAVVNFKGHIMDHFPYSQKS